MWRAGRDSQLWNCGFAITTTTWLTKSLGACPRPPPFSSDHRKFIQMNWLSEFHLPLPRGRANQAKLGTHSRNSSGPKGQTSSKTAGPEDSSVWFLFPSVWFSFWVTFREPIPNSLDVIPLLWGPGFQCHPLQIRKRSASPFQQRT